MPVGVGQGHDELGGERHAVDFVGMGLDRGDEFVVVNAFGDVAALALKPARRYVRRHPLGSYGSSASGAQRPRKILELARGQWWVSHRPFQ